LGAAESLKATSAPLIGAVLVGKDADGGGFAENSRAQAVDPQRSEQSAGHIMTMTRGNVRMSRKLTRLIRSRREH
jgi:hypothetical protein